MAGILTRAATASALITALSSGAFAADLHCVTAALCEGGSDCSNEGAAELQLTLTNMGEAGTALDRNGAALAVEQTRSAPIWRWSGSDASGRIEVLGWREADQAFTYLIIEGGKTALKATGQCEVK